MSKIPFKYGFPHFTKQNSTKYLVKSPRLRVSDIWSFWDYIIKMYKKKKRNTQTFLKSLLEQAKYFFESAEIAPIKSQPLLYYYSFLNLAKIVIAMEKDYDESKVYYHGIRTKVTSTTTFFDANVELLELNPRVISVANEFCKIMGDNFSAYPYSIKFADSLKACVAIHRTYCETFGDSEEYFRLDDVKLEKEGHELIFSGKVHNANRRVLTSLTNLHYPVTEENGEYIFKAIQTMPHYNVTRKEYYNLSSKLKSYGLWSYLENEGTRTYLSTSTTMRFSMESMIYVSMFFLGSITRYHPYLFDKILNEEQVWIVSEFLKTLPRQFLYLVASKVTGMNVLKSRTANL